jgi:hypothetical protein
VCKYCADDNYGRALHETKNVALYARLILSVFIDQLTDEENPHCHVMQDNALSCTPSNFRKRVRKSDK